MILDQLPSYSRVALALTAKHLFFSCYPTGRVPILGHYPGRTVFPLSEKSEPSERDELLLLLEKDNPALGVCFDCRLLCTLESGRGHLRCAQPTMVKWRWPQSGRGHNRPPLLEQADWWAFENETPVHPSAWMPEINWPIINFAEAHLVMNRHLYGETYGLPLRALEYRYEFQRLINFKEALGSHFPLDRHPQGRQYLTRHRRKTVWDSHTPHKPNTSTSLWTFKHTSEAKIIDNELYIARFHSIDGPQVKRHDFANLLSSLELPICRHASFHRSVNTCPYRDMYRPPAEFRCLLLCKNSTIRRSWSCIDCFTDYSVSIWEDELVGWNFKLATYHRLGNCRSPFEPIWKLAIWSTCDDPFRMHLRGPPPTVVEDEIRKLGRVMQQWKMSNGEVAEEKESTWISSNGKSCGVRRCHNRLQVTRRTWSRWEMWVALNVQFSGEAQADYN